MRLTDVSLRQLPFTEKGQKRVRDDLLPGFGVTVGTRTKTFFVMQGQDRRLLTIGRYPEISLGDARREAKRLLAGPLPKKRVERTTEAVSAYLEEGEGVKSPKTLQEYRRYLMAVPDKLLSDISRSDIDMTHPQTVAAWKTFMNWCIRNDLAMHNPFTQHKAHYAVRDRVLSDDEVVAILNYHHPPYSTIVHTLLYTGQRRAQIAEFNMDWLKGDTIEFPAYIMKSKRPHIIPATSTVQILLPQLDTWSGWSKSKKRMDTHTGVSDWVIHDLRRYFSTTMAKLSVPLHITEQIIDHRSTISGVAAIYNRYTYLAEMREAMTRYEEHIGGIIHARSA